MTNALPLPCTASAHDGSARRGDCDDKRGTLIATILGSSLAFIVGSIINVALPQMQAAFGVGPTGAQWIINAYLLPLGALVLIGGSLGDRYGRRKIFLLGLAIFTAACFLCAIAWSFPVLMVGRALEGLGAALLAPTSLAIIADGFSGKERGVAIGTWAAAGAIAGALAPVAGGVIVDLAGWRWAFVAVCPVAVVAILVAYRSVRESTADPGSVAPLDWAGAALSGVGLFALIWALVAVPDQGMTGMVFFAVFGGTALMLSFLMVEWKRGDTAMMPLALFRNQTFSGLSLLTLFLYMALGGLLVLLPYVLIEELGYSATAAGAAILPFPLILGLLSRSVGGTLTERFGPRTLLVTGSVLVACGFWLFSLTPSEDVSYAFNLLPALIVLALGMAASVAPLTATVLDSAGARYAGVASGVNNAISRIAGLIATALLGLVLINSADNLLVGFAEAAWAGMVLSLLSAAAAWRLVAPKAVTPGA
ncbi:MAG: MFS transporter [Pseudomonadota bacterium]